MQHREILLAITAYREFQAHTARINAELRQRDLARAERIEREEEEERRVAARARPPGSRAESPRHERQLRQMEENYRRRQQAYTSMLMAPIPTDQRSQGNLRSISTAQVQPSQSNIPAPQSRLRVNSLAHDACNGLSSEAQASALNSSRTPFTPGGRLFPGSPSPFPSSDPSSPSSHSWIMSEPRTPLSQPSLPAIGDDLENFEPLDHGTPEFLGDGFGERSLPSSRSSHQSSSLNPSDQDSPPPIGGARVVDRARNHLRPDEVEDIFRRRLPRPLSPRREPTPTARLGRLMAEWTAPLCRCGL